MLSQTTKILKEWAVLGETTTQRMSKQHIGGVTAKRDRREWTDSRPISQPFSDQPMNACFVGEAMCGECATLNPEHAAHRNPFTVATRVAPGENPIRSSS